ncbi:ArnT family glycosyltransferase [Siccirubricoccus deserti]
MAGDDGIEQGGGGAPGGELAIWRGLWPPPRPVLVRPAMHIPPSAGPAPDRSLGLLPEALQRRPALALILLCLLLWLPGFFALPATDRDEARFAQASRQMVESGDYVRIRFGAEERNKKPAGIHWLQAGSVQAVESLGLGDRAQIWVYRLPSFFGALLAVLATWYWGRGLVGRRAALLGAAMLASCLVLVAEARIAKTDAALLATIAAAMGLFAQAYLRPRQFTARQAAAFWLMLGLGVLLKGPIGPMVPLLAGITLAVADREAPWLRALRPLWGVPLMIATAAPWFVAIGIATEGRFFSEAVGGDMLSKIGSGEEKHWGPPGFYLLSFGIAAFPGAWIVLCALPAAWRDRLSPPTRFLLAWVVPSWLVFEAVQTKLPHYTMPLYPALMLLGAAWAMDPLRQEPPRWLRWIGQAGLVGVAVGLAATALAAPWWLSRMLLPAAVLTVPLAIALCWVLLRLARRGAWGRAGLAGVLLAVPLYALVLEGWCRGSRRSGWRRGWRRRWRRGRRGSPRRISASPDIPSPRSCSRWAATPIYCAPAATPRDSWLPPPVGWWRWATGRKATSGNKRRRCPWRQRRSGQ